jgi:hypothetical protein
MSNFRAATRAHVSASNHKTQIDTGGKTRNVRGFSEKELDSWPRKPGLAEPAGAALQLSRLVSTTSDGPNSEE